MFQCISLRLDLCGVPVTDLIHSLKFDIIFSLYFLLRSNKGEIGVGADRRMSRFL